MFDVLVYLYENYWRPDACPEPQQLRRKLSAVGFEADEIQDALRWLDGLAMNAQASALQTDETPVTDDLAEPAAAATDGLAGAAAAATADRAPLVLLPTPLPVAATSLRVYTEAESEVLPVDCLGFISFLETAGVLPPAMREMVVDRAMAVGSGSLGLDDLKIIVLMVFWSLGEEPDALVLDELFVDSDERVIH
jgi:Smg protein